MRVASFLSCAAAVTTSSSFHPPWRAMPLPQSSPYNVSTNMARRKLEPAAFCSTAPTEHSQQPLRRHVNRSHILLSALAAAPTRYGNAQDTHESTDRNTAFASRGGGTAGAGAGQKNQPGIYGRVTRFVNKRFFLLGAAVAVSLAYLNPTIGVTGGVLRPELTINKGGE